MTTKFLTGAYPAGYALKSTYAGLDIEGEASIGGTGLYVSSFATVRNDGIVQATMTEDYGASLESGGILTNGSASDTSALIEGGVIVRGPTGTVINHGTISGGSGVLISVTTGGILNNLGAIICSGQGNGIAAFVPNGIVNNGFSADTTALIRTYGSAYAATRSLFVSNFGSIEGSSTGCSLDEGGTITNGSSADLTALITGSSGAGIYNGGSQTSVINFGTIEGGKFGVMLDTGGSVTNGSRSDTTAMITGGREGIYVYSTAGIVTNWGTISGSSGTALRFEAAGCVLEVESESTFLGAVLGGGGTLDLASGVGTISGLSGGNVTVSGSTATTTFTNFGKVEIAKVADFTLTGAALIAPAGTHAVDVEGTLTLAGALTVGGAGGVTDAGLVDQTHTILLRRNARSARVVVAAGATWALDGDVGFARRISENREITVQGTFVKSAGSGVSAVGVYVEVDGLAEGATGTLDFQAGVTGVGVLQVDAGATLEFDRAVDTGLSASFNGTGGVLALKDPSEFAATIGGFSSGDAIDLLAISATSATLGPGDTLVIADGSATIATLQLTGDYTGATFSTASDGHGGTAITVSGAAASAAPPHGLVAAMAAMSGGAGAGHALLSRADAAGRLLLASPRAAAA